MKLKRSSIELNFTEGYSGLNQTPKGYMSEKRLAIPGLKDEVVL